jgi:ABC-type amino acid transport substrate-binding protein
MKRFWERFPRRTDKIALLVLIIYVFLAISAQMGTSVVGQGLDPVWAAAQRRGALRVAVDYGFAPFSDLQNGEALGYDIDLARAVAAKLGLRAEFVASGIEAIYEDLANGKADLAASAVPYAPEQGWRASFSSFYFNAGQVLIVPKDSTVTGVEQLSGLRVGAPLGSEADTYLRKLVMSDPSIIANSEYDLAYQVLDALRRGSLDAAIVDNAAALHALGNYDDLKMVGPALTLEPYVLAMPVAAFQLRSEVNRALDELRAEGFFEVLNERWFVETPARVPQS